MKQPIKHALRDHLQSKQLSGKQIRQLQKLQLESTQQKASKNTAWLFSLSIAVVVILSVLILTNPILPVDQQNMPLLIAEEVTANHLKLKPLEVKTNQLFALNHYFTQLDFVPISSNRLPDLSKTLLGGRYCSLQGITAAQLRLQNSIEGEIQTLYETRYDRKIFKKLPNLDKGEKPVTVFAKGIQVDIWVEKGVLFALTFPVKK